MKVRDAYARYPLVTMVCAFALAGACSGVVCGSDLAAQAASTAFAAVVVMLLIGLLVPQSLGRLGGRLPGVRILGGSDGRLTDSPFSHGLDVRLTAPRMFHVKHYVLLMLAAAVGGAWSMASGAAGGMLSLSVADLVERGALVLLLCAATAVFEEGLFRGIMVPCVIERVRSEKRSEEKPGAEAEGELGKKPRSEGLRANPALVAAVFSALVFGILHVSGSSDDSSLSQIILAGGAFDSPAGCASAGCVPVGHAPAGYIPAGGPCDPSSALSFATPFSTLVFTSASVPSPVSASTPACAPVPTPASALPVPIPVLVLVAQALLKALQAGLFGFCMAAVFLETGSIKQPVVIHAAFNVLYLGPLLVATGAVPATYLTGNCGDLAVLALTIALLLPPSVKSARWLAREVVPYSSFRQ